MQYLNITGAVMVSLLMSLTGCLTARQAVRTYKIYPDSLNQTFNFEMNVLPGQVFKIVIPEIITDNKEILLGWNQKVRHWDIGPDYARWDCEIPGVIRAHSTVSFGQKVIEARVKITNLSQRTWELTNAFTCFAFYDAPLFDNPDLDRIMFPVNGKWRSVADLFAETSPGNGPYTFFSVKGSPPIKDMKLVQLIRQTHPQIIDYGAGCVVSKDGKWVAGASTSHPAYVFCNRRERCIHANPVYDPIRPGETVEQSTYIRIMQGGVADFAAAAKKTAK